MNLYLFVAWIWFISSSDRVNIRRQPFFIQTRRLDQMGKATDAVDHDFASDNSMFTVHENVNTKAMEAKIQRNIDRKYEFI